MIDESLKKQILEVWNGHNAAIKTEYDDEGNPINNIDDSRLYAIEVVKIIVHNFQKGDFNLLDFKIALDSYNKHNNLWGFTAKLGQMYFNQIIKSNEPNLEKLTTLFKDVISEPKNLRDALSKIEAMDKHTSAIYNKAKDKHNAPYPGAVGFFVSYFWQIANYQKWPILYNSLIASFKELGMWEEEPKSQKDIYEQYYNTYKEIREILEEATGKQVSFWSIEHAFWNYKAKAVLVTPPPATKPAPAVQTSTMVTETSVKPEPVFEAKEGINIREYIIPKLSKLLDTDLQQNASDSNAAPEFDQMVAEAFRQLDFEVNIMDQGQQKNPFALIKFREENIAFIVDAKANSEEYFRSSDRRIVKEYVNDCCAELKKEGYKKIGYFVVCNNFEPKYTQFVSYINWNTEIKKVTLLSTEALLYLLAYKIKNRFSLMSLIERIAGFSNQVSSQNIVTELG